MHGAGRLHLCSIVFPSSQPKGTSSSNGRFSARGFRRRTDTKEALTSDSTRKRPSLPASCDPGIRLGFASSLSWPYLVQTRWYMHNASTILTQLSRPGMLSAAGCKQNSAPTSQDKRTQHNGILSSPPLSLAPESIKAPEFLFNLLTTRGEHLRKNVVQSSHGEVASFPLSFPLATGQHLIQHLPLRRSRFQRTKTFPATDLSFSLLFHHLFIRPLCARVGVRENRS